MSALPECQQFWWRLRDPNTYIFSHILFHPWLSNVFHYYSLFIGLLYQSRVCVAMAGRNPVVWESGYVLGCVLSSRYQFLRRVGKLNVAIV